MCIIVQDIGNEKYQPDISYSAITSSRYQCSHGAGAVTLKWKKNHFKESPLVYFFLFISRTVKLLFVVLACIWIEFISLYNETFIINLSWNSAVPPDTTSIGHDCPHYGDVIMGTMASQITSLTIVYSTVYSRRRSKKHQSSASLAFVRRIHRWPANSSQKGPVTRKMLPFDDVIMP